MHIINIREPDRDAIFAKNPGTDYAKNPGKLLATMAGAKKKFGRKTDEQLLNPQSKTFRN